VVTPIDNTTEQQDLMGATTAKAEAMVGASSRPSSTVSSGDSFGLRRVERLKSRGKRTRVEVRRVGPWSVLKFSLLFYFCVMLIVWVALGIVYLVLSAAGAIDALARILGEVFANGPTSTKGATPIPINGVKVFTYLFVVGCVLTVAWSLVNVFVAIIYNLISDVVGGIELTLSDPQR
jgi:hypothetical protein